MQFILLSKMLRKLFEYSNEDIKAAHGHAVTLFFIVAISKIRNAFEVTIRWKI